MMATRQFPRPRKNYNDEGPFDGGIAIALVAFGQVGIKVSIGVSVKG